MKSNIAGDRVDPYRNFHIRLRWSAGVVAGFGKVGTLGRGDVISHRVEGNQLEPEPRVSPGQTEYAPVILERGITQDVSFQLWMKKPFDDSSGTAKPAAAPANLRRDFTVDFYNEAGQLVFTYQLFRAWPTECRGMPELDAQGNAFVIEALVLQNEGWQRGDVVSVPQEPGFTTP